MRITTLSELTIDGKLSLGPGASSKDLFDFYGDELRAWFHGQRAANDAIMVGAGTVRADDPELTVRYAPGRNPLRIVPSSDGKLPLDARLLNDGHPTLVAVSRQASDAAVAALEAKPAVQVIRCGEARVELRELMDVLQDRGVNSLIVEGGSRLLHGLFAADLVGRIIIKHIPVIAGSPEAPTYLRAGEGAAPLALSRWRLIDWFVKSGVAISIYEPLA
jgi:riboflavin-specific deaminase-like protein